MRTLLFTLILLLPWALSAQSTPFDCPKGKALAAAEKAVLLEEVQGAYSKINALKASFTQSSFVAALETSELSSGEVWFQKPGFMKWHYAEPNEQIFVIKKDTLWLYQSSENQVLIDNFKDVIISDLPVAFLMGLGDLKRDFELTQACSGSDGLVLVLKPKRNNANGELKGFSLLVDPQSKLPIGALVTDVAENKTSIILSKIEPQEVLAEDTFSTNFKKGADIIDRRSESEAAGE